MTTLRKTLPAFLLLLLGLGAAPVSGYGDQEQDRNHPSVKWFTAETEHFRFHYEKGLRGVAELCAARAEAIYPEVTGLFGHQPADKVEFLVFDEDFSNGWAIASLNTMAVWSADMGFNLRGSKAWIRDVVAHEFGHVISIQKSAKWKPWIGELQFGWDDASDRKVKSGGWLLWSLNPYSMAMAEGTAQWTSEINGGDRWDEHRAMIERAAVQSDTLLPWGRMGVFSGTGLDYERVYGQGYSLTRHIAKTRGPEMVVAWWKELSRFRHQSSGAAWQALTGQSQEALWKEWRDSTKARADREVQAAQPLVEGRKIFGDAFNSGHPLWMTDSVLLFSSNRGSDYQANSLWACDFARKDTADRFWVVAPVIRSRFTLDTAQRKVWFHSGRDDDDRGRPVIDIYAAALDTNAKGFLEAAARRKQARVTVGMHATSPEVRGDTLAVVVRVRNATRLRLIPASGLELPASEGRDIFPLPDSLGERPAVMIHAAVWAKDGASLFVDWFDGSRRRVDRVSLDGRILSGLGDTLHEWRDPAVSPDGGSVVLSSNRTGIFQLYRQNLSDNSISQLTSVGGGAFQPAVSPDGRRITYVEWWTDGYSLRLLDTIAPFALRPARIPEPPIPAPLEQTWDLASREEPYSPIPDRGLLSPILYAQRNPPLFGAEGDKWKALAGARYQMLDPVRKNTLVFLGLLDLTHGFDYVGLDHPGLVNPRQEKMLLAGWENRSLWPTLFVEAGYQGLRGEDTVSRYDNNGRYVKGSDPWALHVLSTAAGARYSLTTNQKIHAELAYMAYDFDLYQDNFRFQAYSNWSPSVLWTYLDRQSGGEDRIADTRGSFARVQLARDRSELQRSGSFAEVFQVDSTNGRIQVKTASTDLWRASVDLRKAMGNPLWPDQTFEADAALDGILAWDSDADTLNDFYLGGLDIPGYPAYKPGSKEDRTFTGTRSAMFRLATRFPLLKLKKSTWIWFWDEWSAGASVQAGRSWRGDWYDFDKDFYSQLEDYSRSVSWETRLGGRIHSGYPFHLSVKFSRALDDVGGVGQKMATFGSLPVFAHRVEFGLNVGLDEWAIIDQSNSRKPSLPAPRRLF